MLRFRTLVVVVAVLASVGWHAAPATAGIFPSRAWGLNQYGQLGDGSTTGRSSPVNGLGGVDAVAAGGYHSLALVGGTVWSWGLGHVGQLGRGVHVSSPVPAPVPGLTDVVAIAAGAFHSLALKADGSVWSWGWNAYGQLGDWTTVDRSTPVESGPFNDIVAIAAGDLHNLALRRDGHVWAWGSDFVGQLGLGSPSSRPYTVARYVPSVTRISAIAAGGYHSLVVTGGSVIAWGWNGWGQVGDGTTETRDHPVVIGASGEIVAVAAGTAHSLALGADGRVWSWGLGATGQLGRSAGTWTATSGVVGISGVTAVAAGGYNSLALGPNGTVSSWGWNAFGQLGDGTTTDRSSPVAVPGLVGMVSLAAGVAHGLATAG